MDGEDQALADFFISRTGADAPMAGKVGQILEAAGHRVVLQQWDFANRNFMERMDAALASGARVISILTPQYLLTDYCAAEWMHALGRDPLNREGKLIVLRAAECEPRGLLRTIGYWDLIQVRDDVDRLADIVKAAIMPDADRRLAPAGRYWRESRPLIHEAIKPTPSFTGRDSHLLKIDGALWSGKQEAAAITQPAAVTGLGGIGKSTLAREYAWQAQEGYAGVWWLNAASDKDAMSWEGVEQGLVDLGDHYIPGLAKAQDRAKAAQHTLDFLAHGGFSKPWLLIYDNVDDPRVLKSWSPRGNAHALVTSRISNWSIGVAPIEVDAWALPEATAYLVKETGRADLSEASLAELAEALGRLPLALAHAAAYLRRRKAVTVKDYIADLDRHMSGLPKDAEYRSPVYATFRAALAQAEEEAPGASALMSLAAFFAPDDIPEELFEQDAELYPPELAAIVAKRERLADTLGLLDDLSLIDFEPEARTFSVHRIVQAAARDALGADKKSWAQSVIDVAFAAFPEPAQDTWTHCARLVSHVRALHSHVPLVAATGELGWLLVVSGDYSRARAALGDVLQLFNASRAIYERLAHDDPGNSRWQRELSVSNERLGNTYVEQGNLDAALKEYRSSLDRMVPIRDRDPTNSDLQRFTSVTHSKIGDVLRAQGNLPAALDAFNASYAIAERLAKADPGNANWQRNFSVSNERLGDIFEAQGNLDAALKEFRASLDRMVPIRDRDPTNSDLQRFTSVTHSKIGDVLRAQGNLPAALDAFNASYAIAERLAKADPGNANWQRNFSVSQEAIGGVLQDQGDLPAALSAFNASHAIAERLSEADPGNAGWQRDLSVSHGKIGGVLGELGNLPAALDAFNASLAIDERLVMADPGNAEWQVGLAASLGKLGQVHAVLGDKTEALRLFEAGRAIVAPLAESSGHNRWIGYLRSFKADIAKLDDK